MKDLIIANDAFTLGDLLAMLFCMVLVSSMLLFFVRANGLKGRLLELEARHSREIEAVQKEIFRQAIEEISRELHDDFAQRLSIIKLTISTVLPDLQGSNHSLLLDSKRIAAVMIEDMRNLTRYLQINSAKELHLPEVIQEELERIKRTGIFYTDLNLIGVPRELDTKTNLFVYRIVQESLKNVVTHAKATVCGVLLEYGISCLHLLIRDNGVGFSTAAASHSNGLGLKNIKERSSLINASFSIESIPNAGTTINIQIPYPALTEKT